KPPCDDMNPCTNDACNGTTSKCDFVPLMDGVLTPGVSQVPGDCRVHICVGGVDIDAADDTDLPPGPPPAPECTIPTCTMGAHSTPPKAPGAGCNPNGGRVCDGNGACVPCNVDTDCYGPMDDCQHPKCTANMCGTAYTPANTPTVVQLPGNCQAAVC